MQGGVFHGGLDGFFDLVVRLLQHLMDVLCHRAGAALARVNDDQRRQPFWLQSAVNLVKGDLRGIDTELCAADTAWHSDQSGFFEGAEDVANKHRVAAGAFSEKFAGDFGNAVGFVHEDEAVNGDRAFCTYIHGGFLSSDLAIDVIVDITSWRWYTVRRM